MPIQSSRPYCLRAITNRKRPTRAQSTIYHGGWPVRTVGGGGGGGGGGERTAARAASGMRTPHSARAPQSTVSRMSSVVYHIVSRDHPRSTRGPFCARIQVRTVSQAAP